jgi:hypothetical protein
VKDRIAAECSALDACEIGFRGGIFGDYSRFAVGASGPLSIP